MVKQMEVPKGNFRIKNRDLEFRTDHLSRANQIWHQRSGIHQPEAEPWSGNLDLIRKRRFERKSRSYGFSARRGSRREVQLMDLNQLLPGETPWKIKPHQLL
ncbi:uncharacterized protein LOC120121345 [Hibiscus syriacus]|uniref:uncharacterized protein LOC120121345 n=1 Tax=Hibiscus syriacus TaxID=106335 RepID=UPI001922DFB9|nr:uncharacterized protein LOC120121345 [Hibiscus syriacus]